MKKTLKRPKPIERKVMIALHEVLKLDSDLL